MEQATDQCADLPEEHSRSVQWEFVHVGRHSIFGEQNANRREGANLQWRCKVKVDEAPQAGQRSSGEATGETGEVSPWQLGVIPENESKEGHGVGSAY